MTTATADRATQGYALTHDEGEAFWLAGMLQTVRIGGADTGGRYGLIEVVVPPGLGSPWHVHVEEDEWFYVLEGNLTVHVGETHLLVGLAPMQFEGFLREVGQPATARVLPPRPAGPPPDPKRLAEIAKQHGVIILGPPGPPPGRQAAAWQA
jgi:hypothetical protein